ncbi:5'-3' exonuclease [Babesia sp. Xinjiang]|uniref:5'-3' exonuclease n=1 Tax=Babesia sp. Xinjiang TaxID=462227 RepID=UPI000A25F986|nr:5'-3' exonuclease [Babesia sp. Xinjiang]ORM41740.1 5'-3' exonuclease [Babesia sp. Xinjiang]
MKILPFLRSSIATVSSTLCIYIWFSSSAASLTSISGFREPSTPPALSASRGVDGHLSGAVYQRQVSSILCPGGNVYAIGRNTSSNRRTLSSHFGNRSLVLGFLPSDTKVTLPHIKSLFGCKKKVVDDANVTQRANVQIKAAGKGPLRERVLLVDGTGLAYRCFFALPTLTTYRGTEIGAIVGFMNSLGRIYKSFGPKYVGIAFDSPGSNSTKREVWPEYKANRQTIKTSFKKQLMWIKEFCAIVGIPVFLKRATEADDIIASMINFLSGGSASRDSGPSGSEDVQRLRQLDFRVPEPGPGGVFDRVAGASTTTLEPVDLSGESGLDHRSFEVHVLTADKDLLQVLEYNDGGNMNVRVIQPHKKFRVVDEETVIQEYGIHPGRFSEYLALVGDSADNIPGVMGIGPKTAPLLISKYKSFKEIIESEEIAKISKRGGKHSVSVDRAYDFHLITKLRGDVPVLSSLSQLCKKRTLERQFVAFCRMFSLQKCSLRWHDVTH